MILIKVMETALYKVPLLLTPQPEGGYTVTSPLFPELITEGDSAEEAIENARDALKATLEIYSDTGRRLPPTVVVADRDGPVWLETVFAA